MAAAGVAVRTRPMVGSVAANAVATAAADVATAVAGPTGVAVGVVASNVSRHRIRRMGGRRDYKCRQTGRTQTPYGRIARSRVKAPTIHLPSRTNQVRCCQAQTHSNRTRTL